MVRKEQNMFRVAGFVVGLLVLPTFTEICLSQTYKYIDENGHVVFTDNEINIPEPYHKKTTIIQTEPQEWAHRRDDTEPETSYHAISQTQAKEKTRKHWVKIEIKKNHVFVPVKITIAHKKTKLKLLLDTGSDKTLLYERALKGFNLRNHKVVSVQQASGSVVEAKKITLSKLEVGKTKEEEMTALVLAFQSSREEFDGLLGADFFLKHRYVIDYDKQLLYLE
jgi:predicted aspartyl protease